MNPFCSRRRFLQSASLAAAALSLRPALRALSPVRGPESLTKRERLAAWLNKEIDYVPAAFFMHFGDGFKVGPAAARKHSEYFRATDMDFVKIQYEQHYTPLDWIQKPSDWKKLESRGLDFYEPQLVTVRELVRELKSEAFIVMTLYSPFMWAGHCATLPVLLRHMHEDPEAVKAGLDALTESQLKFVRACIEIGVDGFYMSTQGSETGQFTDPSLFGRYVKPHDLPAMQLAQERCPFNILHVCDYNAPYASYEAVADYPGTVVDCSNVLADGSTLSWNELEKTFRRPMFGGLERKGVISTGSSDAVRAEVARVLADTPRRFMLGAECTVPGETPWGNLRAAIDVAHGKRKGN